VREEKDQPRTRLWFSVVIDLVDPRDPSHSFPLLCFEFDSMVFSLSRLFKWWCFWVVLTLEKGYVEAVMSEQRKAGKIWIASRRLKLKSCSFTLTSCETHTCLKMSSKILPCVFLVHEFHLHGLVFFTPSALFDLWQVVVAKD